MLKAEHNTSAVDYAKHVEFPRESDELLLDEGKFSFEPTFVELPPAMSFLFNSILFSQSTWKDRKILLS